MSLKDQTVQDHQERLNRALLFIERNLEQPLSLEEVAKEAFFSPFHFHRVFSAYLSESVYTYIRRLRLERAAVMLKNQPISITDIALKSGYDTPASFTKAFKQLFGINPRAYRRKELNLTHALKPVFKEHFQNQYHEAIKPDYKKIPDQQVLFVRRRGPYQKAAQSAWSSLMRYAYRRKLLGPETRAIGISRDDPKITAEENIRYDACLTVKQDFKPEGEVGFQTITGGNYAVFFHRGSFEKIGELYNLIFGNWLPASGKKLRDIPCFEVYSSENLRSKSRDYKTEIWIPIT